MFSRRFLFVVIVSLFAAWFVARLCKDSLFDIARVTNESMLPFLRPGQRVLLSRVVPCLHLPLTGMSFACRPCEPGSAYVFRHPAKKNIRLIKFAAPFDTASTELRRDIMWFTDGNAATVATGAVVSKPMTAQNACFFLGSNSSVSVDSRQFGPVPLELIEGKVLLPALHALPHEIQQNRE